MITIKVTSNFDTDAIQKKIAEAVEKKTRQMIRERLTFPGSEKLAVDVKIKDDGASLTFRGPDEVVAEAKKRWNRG